MARWCRENLEGWRRPVVRGPGDALLVCGDMGDAALFRVWWLYATGRHPSQGT